MAHARMLVYWSGMMGEIKNIVSKRGICALHNRNRNRREHMEFSDMSSRPSAKIGADLFEYQVKRYLLTIYYYTK